MCVCVCKDLFPIAHFLANVSVCERDRNETKLLLGCDNGTLVSFVTQCHVLFMCIGMPAFFYV